MREMDDSRMKEKIMHFCSEHLHRAESREKALDAFSVRSQSTACAEDVRAAKNKAKEEAVTERRSVGR